MKKILSLTGIIALAAIVSSNAFAANLGTSNSTNPTNEQVLYDNTAPLRTSLAADQAELDALMAGNNPDPKRARTLAENISKSGDELRRQYGNQMASMTNNGHHMGRNYGHNGEGYHMAGNMNGNMAGCM